jgi:hypothetical protein
VLLLSELSSLGCSTMDFGTKESFSERMNRSRAKMILSFFDVNSEDQGFFGYYNERLVLITDH